MGTLGAMSRVSVRDAHADDASAVGVLLADLGYPMPEALAREKIALLAAREDDRVFVAEVGGEVAGVLSFHVMTLFHAPGNLGRITALIVVEQKRRAGVGRALCDAAEAFAWSRDCRRIEVTSGDHRSGAHAFYQRLGYQLDDHRRFIKQRETAPAR